MWMRLSAAVSRLFFALVRRRLDDDARLEIDAHLDLLTERYLRQGMTPEAAHLAARRQVGNTMLVREEMYEMNSIGWIESVARDLRFALRMLRRNTGFAGAAIVTLALGIGATTAVFSVVNAVLIRPLPYPDPDALVAVWHSAQFQGTTSNNIPLSSTMYLTYRERNETFQHFGVWRTGAASVTGLGEPEEVRTLVVTHGTLPALGVQPALGRWFSLADDSAGTPETVMLSEGFWRRRFGGDPAVVGRTITLDSRPREVIGVMPRQFSLMNVTPDVMMPQRFDGDQLRPNDVHSYVGIARLKAGVSIEQASSDVARMLPIWITEYGTDRRVLTAARFAPAVRPLEQDVIGDVARVLWVLMGAIGLVLLIACANVANLLLVRTDGRQQELTLRAALGASKAHIARQLLVESITLGVLGGALGLGLAYAGLRLLTAMSSLNLPRLAEVSIDPLVLAFTLAASLLSGLLFGLIPLAKYVGPRRSMALGNALHAGGRTLSLGRQRRRSQSAVVVAQVALAVVLLIASGLMIRTFQALRDVPPGFTGGQQIQTVRISIPETLAATPDRVLQMQRDIAEQLRTIPGVTSVAFATALPMEREFASSQPVTAEDKAHPEGLPPLRRTKFVSPGLFLTLGTPLVAGRDFTWDDIYAKREVAIVSENLAREMWGEPSAALGRRIRMGRAGVLNEIIGVVGDIHDSGADQRAPSIVYWRGGVQRAPGPSVEYIPRAVTFAIRSSRAGTEDFGKRVGQAVWAVNASLPLGRLQTLGDVYEQSMSRTSFALVTLAIAGSMALILGVIGLYGVISHTVSERQREIGIRLALGAQQGKLRRRFVRYGMTLTGVGVAIGLGGAMGLSRLMSSLLFGISRLDPVTYVAVPLILAIAAALASYLPVRRATGRDAINALKAE
jgi:predicted permease